MLDNLIYLGGVIALSVLGSAMCTYVYLTPSSKKNGKVNEIIVKINGNEENIVFKNLKDKASTLSTMFQPEGWHIDLLNDLLNLDEGVYIFTRYGPAVYDIKLMTM